MKEEMNLVNEGKRRITCLRSRKNYASANDVPSILLEGIWLKELGFHPGDYAEIECNEGQLIIRRRERENAFDPKVAEVQKAYNNLTRSQKRQLVKAISE